MDGCRETRKRNEGAKRSLEPERLGLQQGTMGNGKHMLAFLMRERNEFKPVHHLQPIIFISPISRDAVSAGNHILYPFKQGLQVRSTMAHVSIVVVR